MFAEDGTNIREQYEHLLEDDILDQLEDYGNLEDLLDDLMEDNN